jgi:cytochrome c biogenesis protein CcmG/thiol:disulfide interchange protein DsbE
MLKKLVAMVFGLCFIMLLYKGLGTNPTTLPSVLKDKPLPSFSLPTDKNKIHDSADLKGKLYMLNVFASWCFACEKEHAFLMSLASKIPIYGLDYKDNMTDATSFLKQNGNPYQLIFYDTNGRTAIDLGVYGAPETFLVDKKGIIRYRYAGILTNKIFQNHFLPLISVYNE